MHEAIFEQGFKAIMKGTAYLDPGSGSFLLQLLLAGVLGLLVGIRVFWSKIKALFKRDKKEDAKAKPGK